MDKPNYEHMFDHLLANLAIPIVHKWGTMYKILITVTN